MAFADIINRKQKRQRYLTHLKEDELETIFIRLKTKLEIIEQITTIFKDTSDTEIQKQLVKARQDIKRDILELSKRGTSLIDIFSRLGGVLFKAEIFRAQDYLNSLKDKDNQVIDLVNEDQELYRRLQFQKYGRLFLENEEEAESISQQVRAAQSSQGFSSGFSSPQFTSRMSGVSTPQRQLSSVQSSPSQESSIMSSIHQFDEIMQSAEQLRAKRVHESAQKPKITSGVQRVLTTENIPHKDEPMKEEEIKEPIQNEEEIKESKKTRQRKTKVQPTTPKTIRQLQETIQNEEIKQQPIPQQEKRTTLISPFHQKRQSPQIQDISFAPTVDQQEIQQFENAYQQIQQYNDLSTQNILQLGNLIQQYIKLSNDINISEQDMFDLISQFIANSKTVEGKSFSIEQTQQILDKYNDQTQLILNGIDKRDERIRFVMRNVQNIYDDLMQMTANQQPIEEFKMEGYQQQTIQLHEEQPIEMSQIEYQERGRAKTPTRGKEKTRQPTKSTTRNINKISIDQVQQEIRSGNINDAVSMIYTGIQNFMNNVASGNVKFNPNTVYMTKVLKSLRDTINDQQITNAIDQVLQQKPPTTSRKSDQRIYQDSILNVLQNIQQHILLTQAQQPTEQPSDQPQMIQTQDDPHFQQYLEFVHSGDWISAIDILRELDLTILHITTKHSNSIQMIL